jgi:hypothetical protein
MIKINGKPAAKLILETIFMQQLLMTYKILSAYKVDKIYV